MKYRFVDGNRLQLLSNGTDYFPALEQAIDGAYREIFLETYIFADDQTGRAISAALVRATQRGVTVQVLIDGFGCKDMLAKVREMLVAPVRVLVYHPKISPLTLRRNRLRRLHRKLVVVDGRVAFVGGINIIDDLDTPGLLPPRYDYAVRIEGPLTATILNETVRLWNRIAWINLCWHWRRRRQLLHDDTAEIAGHQRVALVVRDNLRHRSDIEDAYLDEIEQACDEITIANAYFFPGQRFRQALVRAARRGVRVRLLLQGRQEYLLIYYATRALYGALLDAGVEIYEYHKSFMHAKVGVIDQRWATVGSSNIDPFSLMLAREANVIVDDPDFAQELRLSLICHMEDGALVIAKTQWHHQPLWRRVIYWSAYGVVRLLLDILGLY